MVKLDGETYCQIKCAMLIKLLPYAGGGERVVEVQYPAEDCVSQVLQNGQGWSFWSNTTMMW